LIGGYLKTNARLVANLLQPVLSEKGALAAVQRDFPDAQLDPTPELFDINKATVFTSKDQVIVASVFAELVAKQAMVEGKFLELRASMVESPSW
jgi:hypothetical protein